MIKRLTYSESIELAKLFEEALLTLDDGTKIYKEGYSDSVLGKKMGFKESVIGRRRRELHPTSNVKNKRNTLGKADLLAIVGRMATHFDMLMDILAEEGFKVKDLKIGVTQRVQTFDPHWINRNSCYRVIKNFVDHDNKARSQKEIIGSMTGTPKGTISSNIHSGVKAGYLFISDKSGGSTLYQVTEKGLAEFKKRED